MKTSFWRKIDIILMIGVFFGVLICWTGIASNALIIHINDGKFPVVLSDDLYIIPDEKSYRNIHEEAKSTTKIVILADWIYIKFPQINNDNFIFRWWARGLNYPIEGGLNIVSFGDMMMWFGSAMFLIFLGPLIIRIILRIIL
jgi:hypothetical protein